MWHPCGAIPLAGVQLSMLSDGEETPVGPEGGQGGGGMTSDSVMLELDYCSVTTSLFHMSLPSHASLFFWSN